MSGDESTELVRRWRATTRSLREHALRVAFAKSQLTSAPPGEVAAALQRIACQAELSENASRDVLTAFVPLLVDPAQLPRLTLIRGLGQQEQFNSLLRLLRATSRAGHQLDVKYKDKRRNQKANDGEMTLGARRALARQPSRAQVIQLIDDPHPMVVRILLANPRITEDDVLRMAARRPANREVAVEIARVSVRSARVRMALIQNPGTPAGVAVPLLCLLSRPELAQVARAADLAAVVRATAQELHVLRPPLEGPPGSDLVH